jgi:hypothetical protein
MATERPSKVGHHTKAIGTRYKSLQFDFALDCCWRCATICSGRRLSLLHHHHAPPSNAHHFHNEHTRLILEFGHHCTCPSRRADQHFAHITCCCEAAHRGGEQHALSPARMWHVATAPDPTIVLLVIYTTAWHHLALTRGQRCRQPQHLGALPLTTGTSITSSSSSSRRHCASQRRGLSCVRRRAAWHMAPAA